MKVRRPRIRDQVMRIPLPKKEYSVSVEVRIVRTRDRWYVMGLEDGVQHTLSREPCDDSLDVVGYLAELLKRLQRECP